MVIKGNSDDEVNQLIMMKIILRKLFDQFIKLQIKLFKRTLTLFERFLKRLFFEAITFQNFLQTT